MEIMDYNQMLENANAVKVLVNKTIECSKDYTDCKKEDVLDQIVEYIFNTINDVLHDPICRDGSFRAKANCNSIVTFSDYGFPHRKYNLKSASAQFFFSSEGTHLVAYFSQTGYCWADKQITDNGLKKLIKYWPEYKRQLDSAIQYGIKGYNENMSDKLSRQLELHDAIKNFQV